MLTKVCSKCGVEKSLDDYHKNVFDSQGHQKYRGYCKDCANTKEKLRYKEKKEFINAQKTECKKCGENRFYVLDFHHIDRLSKDFTIGQLKKGAEQVIQQEINKCICLCANCHRAFHHLQKENNIYLEDFLNE